MTCQRVLLVTCRQLARDAVLLRAAACRDVLARQCAFCPSSWLCRELRPDLRCPASLTPSRPGRALSLAGAGSQRSGTAAAGGAVCGLASGESACWLWRSAGVLKKSTVGFPLPQPGETARGHCPGACGAASVTPHFWELWADGERKGKRASSHLEWFRGFGTSPDWTLIPQVRNWLTLRLTSETEKGKLKRG